MDIPLDNSTPWTQPALLEVMERISHGLITDRGAPVCCQYSHKRLFERPDSSNRRTPTLSPDYLTKIQLNQGSTRSGTFSARFSLPDRGLAAEFYAKIMSFALICVLLA